MGINAKKELLNIIGYHKILCAEIVYSPSIFDESDKKDYIEHGWLIDSLEITLKYPHTEEELQEFITKLDFNYDNGYGGQKLKGGVILDDYAWLTRGEYDGSEWWEYHKRPEIPDKLKNLQLEREININKLV